jgi:hypothetical protein
MANITNIPAPRVDFIDPRTGKMAREWYRFFLNLFQLAGSGTTDVSLADLQLMPVAQPQIDTTGLSDFIAQAPVGYDPVWAANELNAQWQQAPSAAQLGTIAAVNLNGLAVSGGIIYGSSSALAYTAVGVAGQVLTSNGASAPTWTTPTTGTVTSVALTTPAFLSVSGSPITTSGTLAVTFSGTALPVANGGTAATSASITSFNNITGYTAVGATGTTSTNLVFSTSPTLTTPKATTTIGVGNATPSGSGSGVTFPATQDASTDPNTFDDYEEGSWTPTVTAVSGAYTTVSNQAGVYVKKGKEVTIRGTFTITNKGTGGGGATITNLPFAPDGTRYEGVYTDVSTAIMGICYGDAGSSFTLYRYDGADGIVSGDSYSFEVIYFI